MLAIRFIRPNNNIRKPLGEREKRLEVVVAAAATTAVVAAAATTAVVVGAHSTAIRWSLLAPTFDQFRPDWVHPLSCLFGCLRFERLFFGKDSDVATAAAIPAATYCRGRNENLVALPERGNEVIEDNGWESRILLSSSDDSKAPDMILIFSERN